MVRIVISISIAPTDNSIYTARIILRPVIPMFLERPFTKKSKQPQGLGTVSDTSVLSAVASSTLTPSNDQVCEAESKAEEVRANNWYDGFVRLFVWYPGFLPRAEKLFLFKLDVILLLYVCASYFTKALDKSNITKAFNANMDKDIGFYGNDLSYAKSLYSAGYIVSMGLGTLLVTRPRARLMLPILETIWGVLTFCQAACTTPSQIFALRFLVGLAEGPIFPSVVYTIGSWYKRDEVYRRIMAFSISSSLGGMFSGFLQSAAYTNLDGKGGLSGWKWGFIIDGIFTVPIALLGFFFYPGSLDQAQRVWWLKKTEFRLAQRRMIESGVKPATKLSWSITRRVLESALLYCILGPIERGGPSRRRWL